VVLEVPADLRHVGDQLDPGGSELVGWTHSREQE
jgi:hypothetical protein